MDCERRLIYASGSADGFEGNFVRIIDISAPARPREVGRWWCPVNDVFVDKRGFIYLIDRVSGLDILRFLR